MLSGSPKEIVDIYSFSESFPKSYAEFNKNQLF